MLDPQVQALLDLMKERGVPPTHLLSPEDARKMYSERRFYSQPKAPEVKSVNDFEIPGKAGTVKTRSYRPINSEATQILPALVYFHGGGCVIGDLDTHDVFCRELANNGNCAVFSIDYRLAPENPFPAAIEDCASSTEWIHDNAASLKIDPKRIAVGGDSAGGNMAAITCLILKEKNAFKPAFQLLIYPMIDTIGQFESMTKNGEGYLLTKDAVEYYLNHYLPDSSMRQDWRVAALLAKDHLDLPPALVITAGFDPLRDEGLAYANKLSSVGVPCQYICFERQIHGFILMGRIIDEANTAMKLCAQALIDNLKSN